MTRRPPHNDHRARVLIAQEAAKIMAEEGQRDFLAAKRKAAERLGMFDTRNMPRNLEVQDALQDYQRLFLADTQPHHLRRLREAAIPAMEMLAPFRPRLSGPVLDGTADAYSEITLHLFADTPEDVAFFLMDRGIPYELGERRLKHGSQDAEDFPVYRLAAEDLPLELVVFPVSGLRQAPRSALNGRPVARANVHAVRELLEAPE